MSLSLSIWEVGKGQPIVGESQAQGGFSNERSKKCGCSSDPKQPEKTMPCKTFVDFFCKKDLV